MEAGTRIWVTDPKEGWVLATLNGKKGKEFVITIKGTNDEQVRSESECYSTLGAEPGLLRSISDLTRLPALHEPALLQALQERYEHDEIYTSVGPILIAVNPFKKIKSLYEQSTKWISRQKDLPPHVYGLADASFRSMVDHDGCNQSILVSGESGAGKTETTKHAMQYLTEVSGGSGGEVSAKILSANPLLEAFGNAKTVRNDNSSRFGKLIEMKFGDSGRHKLVGAGVTSYLLEKARVVHQARGERNYHIFYELFGGLNASLLKKYLLSNPKGHHYLSSSGEFKRADIEDFDQYKKTEQAMTTLGFTAEDCDQMFRIVSGILHLGDIDFEDRQGGEACAVSTMDALENAAQMLGIDCGRNTEKSLQNPDKTLADVLCVRRITVQGVGDATGQGETYVKPLNRQFAQEARDAMAMAIYERLFAWIVWRVNYSMEWEGAQDGGGNLSKGPEKLRYQYRIGVLDIFGFEVFDENFFEQLCINYANEQLQSQFNEHVFELEQKMYEAEGVDWTFVAFPDNSPTINMIEAKPIGLLSLIDEECMYPSGGDKSLASKLYQNLNGKSDRFVAPHQQQRDGLFTVRHFAGDVTYTVDGFYRKNKNELRQDAVDLICTSTNFLTRVLLPPDAQEAAGGADAASYFEKRSKQLGSDVMAHPGSKEAQIWSTKPLPVIEKSYAETGGAHGRARSSAGRRSQLQQTTVSSHFKSQLHSALSLIRASKPHYVRCLKPNDKNKSNIYHRPRVLSQLRYSGVVEVVKVARAGYPTRYDVPAFVETYASLISLPPTSSLSSTSTSKGQKKSKGNSSSTAGLAEARRILASQDDRLIKQCAESICISSKLERNKDFQVGKTKVFLRADAVSCLEQAKNNRLKGAVMTIQRTWRKWYRTHRNERAALKIQRRFRGFIARKKVKRILVRRRAAADLIHSDVHFQRWLDEVRARLKMKYEIDLKQYEDMGSTTTTMEMSLLWWYVVPLTIIAGVPRFLRQLYRVHPHLLLIFLLCLTGLAFGSVLVLDAQRKGVFAQRRSEHMRRRSSSTKQSLMEKKRRKASALLFDGGEFSSPLSAGAELRRRQSTSSVASRKTSVSSSKSSPRLKRFGGFATPPAPQPVVQIAVNANAIKKFAGLATRKKEAMERAKRKAEDMLRTGELETAMRRGSTQFLHATTVASKDSSLLDKGDDSKSSHSSASSVTVNGDESPRSVQVQKNADSRHPSVPFQLGRRASNSTTPISIQQISSSNLGQSNVSSSTTLSSTTQTVAGAARTSTLGQQARSSYLSNVQQRETTTSPKTSNLGIPSPKTSSLGVQNVISPKTSNLGIPSSKTSSLGIQPAISPQTSSLGNPPTPPGKSSPSLSKAQELLRRSSNPPAVSTNATTTTKPTLPPNKPNQGNPIRMTQNQEAKDRAESGLNENEQYMLNKAILSMFLEDQAPEELEMADDLLAEFRGKEEVLFDKLTEEFPEVDALHSTDSTDTPAWERFASKRKQRQSHRGFFGTASPDIGLDEHVRVVQEKTSSGAKKNRFSLTTKKMTEPSSHPSSTSSTSSRTQTALPQKKKSETSSRGFLSRFTGGS